MHTRPFASLHFINRPLLTLAVSVVVFCVQAYAERIQWSSATGVENLGSSGMPMDGGFTFELGVFDSGFQPQPSNIANWSEHWQSADESTYSTSEKRYAGLHTVTDNEPPFLAGTPAWIMGTKVTPTGTEKILFRRPEWTWPEANPISPSETVWGVQGDANIHVVIGTVHPDGSPFLMRSDVFRDYPQWRALTLAGEPQDAPGDDSDGDGLTNLMEFVFDTDPRDPASRATTTGAIGEDAVEAYLQLRIPRKRTHLARLTVQVSSDLENWAAGPGLTEVVTDEAGEWIVRDKTPFSPSTGKRFMRLKIDLP